ncbi:hypothetical protein [Mesorhizobium australicum]|uniref:Uncharacterized protein n=1 Tax=Mesorhizobium australicum TaxID=536018 RepID=A0A1X7MMU9_9HYPH|nr:hypothetical protein [Mesorhizobium australicum]SMH26159.1 hypothetical protein SAMN02982922_0057 [Mesorhizobium australicum]
MMGKDIFECGFNAWLAMGILSIGLPLVAVLLLLAIAAFGRYVLTGRWSTRMGVR